MSGAFVCHWGLPLLLARDGDLRQVWRKELECDDQLRALGATEKRTPPPVSPASLVGELQLPFVPERRNRVMPRFRRGEDNPCRRTEEEQRLLEEKRRQEYERSRFRELPNVAGPPSDVQYGSGLL